VAEPDERIASGYDTFYAAWGKSPMLRTLWREHVTGPDYPEEYAHISFLPLDQLRSVADALRLTSASTFADLACGAGGPGLWVSNQTGAALVGIDLSAAAVARATERAEALGLTSRATFRQGSFESTGLGDASIDAAMSIDALQYAPDKAAGLRELARIVRSGGRLSLVAFELDGTRVEGMGVWEDPVGDYRPLLADAGFDVISYEQIPGWSESVKAGFGAVVDQQDALAAEMGNDAAGALALEAAITLQLEPYCGHVLAVAERR